MANVYDKLKEMNITLPAPPPKGGVYTPALTSATATTSWVRSAAT